MDTLGNLVAENVDREALLRLIEDGVSERLPIVNSQLSTLSGQQRAAVADAPLRAGAYSVPNGEDVSRFHPSALAIPGSDEQRSKS